MQRHLTSRIFRFLITDYAYMSRSSLSIYFYLNYYTLIAYLALSTSWKQCLVLDLCKVCIFVFFILEYAMNHNPKSLKTNHITHTIKKTQFQKTNPHRSRAFRRTRSQISKSRSSFKLGLFLRKEIVVRISF